MTYNLKLKTPDSQLEARTSKLEAGSSKLVTALITGGAGFIGSHIADELVGRGWQVIILDNLSTGRLQNIQHLLSGSNSVLPCPTRNSKLETGNSSSPLPTGNSKLETGNSSSPLSTGNSKLETGNSPVTFINGSITDLPLLQKLFSGVDYIFHQAAIPSVPRSIENPLASYEANVTGTLNVLIAARDNKVKKVVFASSSSVYGGTSPSPDSKLETMSPDLLSTGDRNSKLFFSQKEDMLPNPLSPYAANKISAEYHCLAFNKAYGLPVACLRYFNVYGPRQDPNSQYAAVIPKFIQSIMQGVPPTIFGDGEQSRDFTFVRDVANANILAAETDAVGVFNIGRGDRITLNQLTQLIIDLVSSLETRNLKLETRNLKPIYQKERAGDIKHSLADISRARSFGYNPEYDIQKGLLETIVSMSRNVVKGGEPTVHRISRLSNS